MRAIASMTAIATLVGLKAMETAITAIQGMMVIGRLTGKLTDMPTGKEIVCRIDSVKDLKSGKTEAE